MFILGDATITTIQLEYFVPTVIIVVLMTKYRHILCTVPTSGSKTVAFFNIWPFYVIQQEYISAGFYWAASPLSPQWYCLSSSPRDIIQEKFTGQGCHTVRPYSGSVYPQKLLRHKLHTKYRKYRTFQTLINNRHLTHNR
jgi:hypothetical protein